jgi:S1-C subfamily serine protease
MEIEKLTKTQIILLTLFASFVTSIATGIVTVTLMEQAPQSVTQTINKVVERTVERVVPGETKVKEVPVVTVTTEEDLIAAAAARVKPALVQITADDAAQSDNAAASTTPVAGTPLGTGFLVSSDGYIFTTNKIAEGKAGNFAVVLQGGAVYDAHLVAHNTAFDAALLKISADDTKVFPSINLSDPGPVLGKTVIMPVTFNGQDKLEVGLVSGITPGSVASDVSGLETTISAAENELGSPLVDTKGTLVGMQTGPKISLHLDAIKSILDTTKSVQ